jgi:hypothetical protein
LPSAKALGKALHTLGKGFAEHRTQQTLHDLDLYSKGLFAESHLSDRGFAESHRQGSWQRFSQKNCLPRATLGILFLKK